MIPASSNPSRRTISRGERRGLLGRPDRRAAGADLHASAGGPPRQVDLDADAHRRRHQVQMLGCELAIDDRFRSSPAARAPAIGRGVGDQDVLEAVLTQPERLRQRERHHPAEAIVARQDLLEQRAAAHATCWPRGPSSARRARRRMSAALAHIASRSTNANGASTSAKTLLVALPVARRGGPGLGCGHRPALWPRASRRPRSAGRRLRAVRLRARRDAVRRPRPRAARCSCASLFAAIVLGLIWRPAVRGRDRRDLWLAAAFGLTLAGDERLLLRVDRPHPARNRGHVRVHRAARRGGGRLAQAARPALGGARRRRHRPALGLR